MLSSLNKMFRSGLTGGRDVEGKGGKGEKKGAGDEEKEVQKGDKEEKVEEKKEDEKEEKEKEDEKVEEEKVEEKVDEEKMDEKVEEEKVEEEKAEEKMDEKVEESEEENKRKRRLGDPRLSWAEGMEERCKTVRIVTVAGLEQQLSEHFMADEEVSSVLKAIQDDPSLQGAITPNVLSHIDFAWHSALDDDPAQATTTLLVQGMSLPFSRLLIRQFLEKPNKNSPLPDEDFVVVDDAVYVTYNCLDLARRQKRRIHGTKWPQNSGSTLTVLYSSKEQAQAAIAQKKLRSEEEEAKLRAAVADAMQQDRQAAKVSLDDLFSKTVTKPRLYYKFEPSKQAISRARSRVESDLRRLINA